MRTDVLLKIVALSMLTVAAATSAASARDAAFLSPNSSSRSGANEDAVKVEPKADIDVGETTLNVVKRVTVFFANQTGIPIKIEKVTLGGDSTASAEETASDCAKQGSIAPLSRCSIEVSVTPLSTGPWSVDVLMTHGGAGRIVRARIFGKTGGQSSGDGKSMGLSISSKEIKPIDFGSVDIGGGKVVRSALMVNDSTDPITLNAIDVIAADNGLERFDQGCHIDMELPPGASCPVTLLWEPKDNTPISTDLIIRHTGKLGFTVIPIRGQAQGMSAATQKAALSKGSIPMPMSAKDLEKEVQRKIEPVSETELSVADRAANALNSAPPAAGDGSISLALIGTVGTRAVFALPNGQTVVIRTGDEFEMSEGTAKLAAVYANAADIKIGEKLVTLPLKAASSLVAMAIEAQTKDEPANTPSRKKGNSSSNKDGKK